MVAEYFAGAHSSTHTCFHINGCASSFEAAVNFHCVTGWIEFEVAACLTSARLPPLDSPQRRGGRGPPALVCAQRGRAAEQQVKESESRVGACVQRGRRGIGMLKKGKKTAASVNRARFRHANPTSLYCSIEIEISIQHNPKTHNGPFGSTCALQRLSGWRVDRPPILHTRGKQRPSTALQLFLHSIQPSRPNDRPAARSRRANNARAVAPSTASSSS